LTGGIVLASRVEIPGAANGKEKYITRKNVLSYCARLA
jgi:hypothetical protein